MNRSRFRVRVRFWQKLEALQDRVCDLALPMCDQDRTGEKKRGPEPRQRTDS